MTWATGILTDLGTVARGRSRHRPRDDPALYGGEFPFFQTGDVKAAELWLRAYSDTYNHAGLAQSRLWPAGTLAITIAANIAESAILGVPGCFPDSVVGFTPTPKRSDVVFVKYLLDYVRYRFQSISRGTTQDNLSVEKLLSVEVQYPPLPTQRKIAAILSAYDDLIDNNDRRIDLLEEIAQRIYSEWFVDFRYPGHEGVRLVGSESTPIPEGWTVRPLRDSVELLYGKALKASDRRAGHVPVFGAGGLIGVHDRALVDDPGIVVGRKGNVGSLSWSDGPFFPIDTTYYVKSALPLTYVFFGLRELEFVDSHAAVPGLNREQAYALPWLTPDSSTLAAFDRIISPIFSLRSRLEAGSANLRQSRDLLLPRLVSGHLDIEDLDIEVPAA
jgi:type I restriction enzyme S subunit